MVIGAGPSGSMAAKFLALKGYDVVMIEKRPVIGTPVRCGEATGARKRLADFITVDESYIETDLNGVMLYGPGGQSVKKEMPGVGLMLDRSIFDPFCAQEAENAGAEVVVNARATDVGKVENGFRAVKVMHLETEVEILAKMVIGADGVEALTGRWTGLKSRQLPPYSCSAIELRIDAIDENPDYLTFWQGCDYINDGYIWSFPKMKTQATNFGAGFITPKMNTPNIYEVADEWREKLFPGSNILDVSGGLVPVSGSLEEQVADHFLLVGDAAHHTNPLTGGGIASGMFSGQIAADVLDECFKAGDLSKAALKKYEQKCWDKFGRQHMRELMGRDYVLGMKPADQIAFYKVLKLGLEKGKWSAFINHPIVAVKTALDLRRITNSVK